MSTTRKPLHLFHSTQEGDNSGRNEPSNFRGLIFLLLMGFDSFPTIPLCHVFWKVISHIMKRLVERITASAEIRRFGITVFIGDVRSKNVFRIAQEAANLYGRAHIHANSKDPCSTAFRDRISSDEIQNLVVAGILDEIQEIFLFRLLFFQFAFVNPEVQVFRLQFIASVYDIPMVFIIEMFLRVPIEALALKIRTTNQNHADALYRIYPIRQADGTRNAQNEGDQQKNLLQQSHVLSKITAARRSI